MLAIGEIWVLESGSLLNYIVLFFFEFSLLVVEYLILDINVNYPKLSAQLFQVMICARYFNCITFVYGR
jgi:hypothetical protein